VDVVDAVARALFYQPLPLGWILLLFAGITLLAAEAESNRQIFSDAASSFKRLSKRCDTQARETGSPATPFIVPKSLYSTSGTCVFRATESTIQMQSIVHQITALHMRCHPGGDN
jgi:hypothetical protein